MIRRAIILVLSLIGLLLSLKLTQVYINANFMLDAAPSFCNVNNIINCDGVAQSKYSIFFGIPLSVWGLLFYSFIIFLTFSDKLATLKLFSFLKALKHPMDYVFAFSTLAFAISVCLGLISYFLIHKICTLCFATYLVDGLIALTAGFGRNLFKSIGYGFEDLREFLSDKSNKQLFTAAVVFFAVMVILINQYGIFKPSKSILEKAATPTFLIVEGNTLGDENAKVIIHEYTDYMCPFCALLNYQLHMLVNSVDGVKVILHSFPLDKECNRLVTRDFHIGSCLASRYAIASKQQNKFWEYSSLLFENNDKEFTEDKLIKIGLKAGLDIDRLKKDAYSQETNEALKNDIDQSIKMGFDSTPILEINGKIYLGVPDAKELQDIVIKNGATLKKNYVEPQQ